MTKKPLINGLAALVYIVTIVSIMNYGTKLVAGPDTIIAPIAAVSLFTLSAAVMGYVFCYQPIQLYFDGKKKEAVRLFLQTVAIFGLFTTIILIILFSGIFTKV